jgi:hypothetical protein
MKVYTRKDMNIQMNMLYKGNHYHRNTEHIQEQNLKGKSKNTVNKSL